MKQLTDEQYEAIGRSVGWAKSYAVEGGRRAYVASFPHAVAEALEEPSEATIDKHFRVAFRADFSAGDVTVQMVRDIFASRLARLTVKPDAAVEAVKALTINWMNMKLTDGSAREIVAAVDAARAKEAK